MTPKTIIEEPIPGNSLSSRRMHARISQKSEPMIRQAPVFEKASTTRTNTNKNKNTKNTKIHHKAITISTYNVRTLKQTGKLHQLVYGCSKNNIDLVAIQEHRWQTTEQINTCYTILNDQTWRFEYSSATSDGHGGIGLLINPRMSAFFNSSEKVSNRIMMVHFNGNPATTIIIAYAPTEDKSDIEKDTFYNDLQQCTLDVPPHNVLILADDLNARIGTDSHTTNPRTIGKYTYHQLTDDNGNRLINYCETCNMRSTQTRFPHPKSRSWTWLHPNGKSKAQIDHILINGKWLNSIRNVRAYNTVELNSDHRIVSAKLSISLRAPKQNKNKRIKFDWNKLKTNSVLQAQFNIEVQNRYEILQNINTDHDIQTKYDNFITSIQDTTVKLIGKTTRKKRKNWASTTTIDLLEKRNSAKSKFKQQPSRENKKHWHILNKQLDESYNNDKINFLEDKLEQLKQAMVSNHLRTTWSLIDEISGKRTSYNTSKIKRKDGTKINSTNELMHEWKAYFEELLNAKTNINPNNQAIPPAPEDLPINQGPITINEVEQAINQLKDGKSPGIDHSITPEVLKYGGRWIMNQLCSICNEIYNNQQTPKQFNTNIIIPIPKKATKRLQRTTEALVLCQ
ncbi:unnamed protein product [Rotaria socialis]